jgi:hypothetical protein
MKLRNKKFMAAAIVTTMHPQSVKKSRSVMFGIHRNGVRGTVNIKCTCICEKELWHRSSAGNLFFYIDVHIVRVVNF